jgi:hypothetical protein
VGPAAPPRGPPPPPPPGAASEDDPPCAHTDTHIHTHIHTCSSMSAFSSSSSLISSSRALGTLPPCKPNETGTAGVSCKKSHLPAPAGLRYLHTQALAEAASCPLGLLNVATPRRASPTPPTPHPTPSSPCSTMPPPRPPRASLLAFSSSCSFARSSSARRRSSASLAFTSGSTWRSAGGRGGGSQPCSTHSHAAGQPFNAFHSSR